MNTCVLTNEGEVLCFGDGEYGPQDEEVMYYNLPVAILNPQGDMPLRDIKQISNGAIHTCALTNKGEVLCFGGNAYGVLGNGDGNERASFLPSYVLNPKGDKPLTNIKQISTGILQSCAIEEPSGAVLCWGVDGV